MGVWELELGNTFTAELVVGRATMESPVGTVLLKEVFDRVVGELDVGRDDSTSVAEGVAVELTDGMAELKVFGRTELKELVVGRIVLGVGIDVINLDDCCVVLEVSGKLVSEEAARKNSLDLRGVVFESIVE